jgi:hypothetical protein
MRKAYHSGLMVDPSGTDAELGKRKTMRVRRDLSDPRREHAFARRKNLGRRLERRV